MSDSLFEDLRNLIEPVRALVDEATMYPETMVDFIREGFIERIHALLFRAYDRIPFTFIYQ